MSFKVIKNVVSLKDETSQSIIPVGMFSAGADLSLKEFKDYTDATINRANEIIDSKVAESLAAIPDDYTTLGNKVKDIEDTYYTEYMLGSVNDFNYLSGYTVDNNGKYISVPANVKTFSYSDYFKISDGAESIEFRGLSEDKDEIIMFTNFYDKHLNYLGHGIHSSASTGLQLTGLTKINVLKSNNDTLTADARYLKISISENPTPKVIFDSIKNLMPVRLLNPSAYNEYTKSRIQNFDFIKDEKKFVPSKIGQTIIDDFTVEKDHKYKVFIKSSSPISGAGTITVGLDDDNFEIVTHEDLYNGTSLEFTPNISSKFSRVFISVVNTNCTFVKDMVISAVIRDLTNSDVCDSFILKSDITDVFSDINSLNNDLNILRHNGLLPLTPEMFKWRIGMFSSDGTYYANVIRGIASDFMDLTGTIVFSSKTDSMIGIYIYNNKEEFINKISADLTDSNNHHFAYSFNAEKNKKYLYRISYTRGKNNQTTVEITSEDIFKDVVNDITVAYSDSLIGKGYLLTSDGNGTFIWKKDPDIALIDDTLSDEGACADAKATGDAINNLKTKIDDSMNTLKKSVSDGKTLVAAAITGKGVATENTDSFEVMANNIGSIKSGGKSNTQILNDTLVCIRPITKITHSIVTE